MVRLNETRFYGYPPIAIVLPYIAPGMAKPSLPISMLYHLA